ncbi:MAG TPA: OsmC family protein [Candidatus Dormibacteraeota bacterium]|nr:OsmC family protein [Candidatus Dormibacteraeota bacterium]
MTRVRSATLVHEGGDRFVAITGTTRTIVYGDDFSIGELSPVETVTVSLAACSAMDVVSILVKKRQQVSRYAIRVEAIQRDEYPQILTRAEVIHEVEGPVVEEAAVRRAIELSATKYCPVNAMLSAGATEVHHGYVVRNTGPEPFEAEGEVVVTGPYRRPDIVP